jgi:hypothetical protein
MLKRPITYTDFNDVKVTENFYFNLTKIELIRMEFGDEQGFEAAMKRLIASNDRAKILKTFEDIILSAYGEKSEDGKKFVKSEALSHEFSQTAAYDQLITELTEDEGKAADFIIGVVPKELAQTMQKANPQDKPTGPPPAPRPPMPPSL